jgi:UDP-glucose 4-epimerase
MRYLITGGAGFIGSHLTDRLLEEGHQVHAFDNLSTGRRQNVEQWADHERFTLTVGNVLDEQALASGVEQCDRVVHLAAAVGVKRILDKPVETIQTNVGGTENVLELARKHDTKVLLASTSEIYGKAMGKDESLDALHEDGDWTLGATSKRRWAYACLIPWVPARAAGTAWSFRTLWSGPWRTSRFRCTGTAPRPAALPTSTMPCGPC